jgi:PiT family inorganic phosphate transporter
MLIAAMMVCLGHGANDVANSISPLVIAASANGQDGKYPYAIGSIGISLGLLTLGKKVMETVGKKVTKFDFAKGYCA